MKKPCALPHKAFFIRTPFPEWQGYLFLSVAFPRVR